MIPTQYIKVDTIELAGQNLVSFYYQGQIVFTTKYTSIPELILQGGTEIPQSCIQWQHADGTDFSMDVQSVTTIVYPTGTHTYSALPDQSQSWQVTSRAIELFDFLVHYLFQACCGFSGGTPGDGTVTSVGFEVGSGITAVSVYGSPITAAGIFSLQFNGDSTQYVRGDGTLASLPAGTGTVTSVNATVGGNALHVGGVPITSVGTMAFTWSGSTSQYVRGDGTLATLPSSSAVWGSITGTITDQTDLISYLSGNYIASSGSTSISDVVLNGNIQVNGNPISGTYGQLTVGIDNAILSVVQGSYVNSININSSIATIFQSTDPVFAGAQYDADYSANFTARSLVDKAYVDSLGGNYIPLSGTTVGNSVTGNINIDSGLVSAYYSGDTAGEYNLKFGYYSAGGYAVSGYLNGSELGGRVEYGANSIVIRTASTYQTFLTLFDGSISIESNNTSFAGAQYASDYSANFVARSLVDKGYVDAAIAGAGGLPSQGGHAGQWLTTNGTIASWAALSGNVSAFTNDAGYITSASLTGYVPTTRTLTINGTTLDLSANRSWSVGDVLTSGSYANPSWITSLAWSKITSTPTTLSGYGITDAVPASRTLTINGTAYDLSADRSWTVSSSTTPYAETPSGTINGSNVTFTLANTPANTNGVIVVLDGVTQYNGVDYTVSGTTITFTTAPASGSTIFAYYNTSSASNTNSILSYAAKSANYTITSTDYTIDCTGTITITLPTAVGKTGQSFVIKNSGTGVVTLNTTSSQTIDGATSKILNVQYLFLTVQSNGSNWIIISQ